MTTTYDPFDPAYWEPADLRAELDRVFDLCHGCRLCFKFCGSFPTLFDLIDRDPDQRAETLTADEQHRVVDECFGCKVCGELNCPYTPGKHEWAIDFPRLMLRAGAVRRRTEGATPAERVTDQVLGRTDLVGRIGAATAPIANRVLSSPGSVPRRLVQKVTGIAAERVLAPYARTRFSTWFKQRARLRFADRQGRVAVFPTCMVEYQDTQIGKDLVRVYERNGIECSLPEGIGCCGAPWLHAGDVDHFKQAAARNLGPLAAAVRAGQDVVVPQPTCSYVLKRDYVDYVGGADADLVAANTYDAAEYLVGLHKADGTSLDTDFKGHVPDAVTYHAPCHLRAQNIGLRSRDLLKLTGTTVTVVAECSGIDGTWGLRADNYEASTRVGQKLTRAITRAGNEVLAGDCALANGGIREATGTTPVHPLSLLARAYGIAAD